MEFGEIHEGTDEGLTGATRTADIPDLTIETEPTPPLPRVEEPAVDESMLSEVDNEPEVWGRPIDQGRDAPHAAEMAHVEGDLTVRYK